MRSLSDFIAETDGSGKVLWVWCREPGARVARPVSDPQRVAKYLPSALTYGAPTKAISAWLSEHAESAPRKDR